MSKTINDENSCGDNDRSWNEWMNRIKQFVSENGHSKIPVAYVSLDGYRLGEWCHQRRAEIRSLGAPEPVNEVEWQERLDQLKAFARNATQSTDGHGLWDWCNTQRRNGPGEGSRGG